jgi:transcriptional regulator with XRE-family HTH domain
MKRLNIIWQQVVKLRQRNRWTQEEFAVQLQFAGWHNATRSTVSKIEGGSIHIADFDVLIVAAALRVRHFDLYPEINWSRPMDETIHQNLHDEIHGLNSDSEPNQRNTYGKHSPNQTRDHITADRTAGVFHPGIRRYARRELFQRLSPHPARPTQSLPRPARQAARPAHRTFEAIGDGMIFIRTTNSHVTAFSPKQPRPESASHSLGLGAIVQAWL